MPRSTFSDNGELISSKTKKQTYGFGFRWTSCWEFIMVSIICSSGTHSFVIMTKHPLNTDEGNIVQFILAYIIFGLPLMYMQVIIGQYTQTGIILFKNLAPVGHGLSYAYILNLFLRSVELGIGITEYLVYLLTSARDKYLDKPTTDITETHMIFPPFEKILPLVFGWFITVICLIYTISNFRKIMLTLMGISLTLLFLLLVGLLATKGGNYFFQEISRLDLRSWYELSAWTISTNGAVSLLALGRPFHVVHGSYLSPSSSSGILTVVAVTLNFFVSFCCTLVSFSCYGGIKASSHTENKYIPKLPYSKNYITMALIPQTLAIMGVEQFWSGIYFMCAVAIQLNNQMIHLMTFEKCLCDAYPKLLRYRKYVLSFLCFFSFLVGFVLISKGMYAFLNIYIRAIYAAATINCMLTSVLVSWIYGVQRLCDDIHYLCGSQPSMFWKSCWYISPAILIVAIFVGSQSVAKNDETFTARCLYFILVLLFTCPVPIYAVLETFRYIKKRNLIGLFNPTENFGPPDPDDRKLRKIYNPRTEIRSRRRTDACQHRCLLGNKNLQNLIQEDLKSSINQSIKSTDTFRTALGSNVLSD